MLREPISAISDRRTFGIFVLLQLQILNWAKKGQDLGLAEAAKLLLSSVLKGLTLKFCD